MPTKVLERWIEVRIMRKCGPRMEPYFRLHVSLASMKEQNKIFLSDTMIPVFTITPNGYVVVEGKNCVMRSREYCYKGAFTESKKGHSFLDQRFDCSSHHLFIYSLLSLSLTSFPIHPPSPWQLIREPSEFEPRIFFPIIELVIGA